MINAFAFISRKSLDPGDSMGTPVTKCKPIFFTLSICRKRNQEIEWYVFVFVSGQVFIFHYRECSAISP